MSVPVSVPLVKVAMPPRDELMPALERVLYSGFVAEGQPVYDFEDRFRAAFGLPRALAMSSGTAALHAALVLAGVRPGDEVVTTSMTAEPTNLAILHAGARPVFADVEPRTGNVDPASINALLSDRTRAVVVVHYAGYPVRMKAVLAAARERRVPVIEDCAHALGARYDEAPVGTLGAFGIFSFQAIKHMTTVDGGALTFADPALMTPARKFRWFGLEKGVARTEASVTSVGYKYNMHNVAATIGLAQLDHIGQRIARHIDNGRFFDARLASIPGLEVVPIEAGAAPSYWLYTLLADDSDDVARRLADVGVAASKLHRPNHLHPVFGEPPPRLPGLESFYRRLIHVPCGWWVTDEVRETIVRALERG